MQYLLKLYTFLRNIERYWGKVNILFNELTLVIGSQSFSTNLKFTCQHVPEKKVKYFVTLLCGGKTFKLRYILFPHCVFKE